MNDSLSRHPYRSLGTILALAVCCFLISASGQDGTYWSGGPGWLGAIGWFSFLALALVFVLTAGYLAVSATRRRSLR